MNDYDIRIVSSLEKILPKNSMLDLPIVNRISGFRKENVSFQIAYRFNGNYRLDQMEEQGSRNPSVKVSADGPWKEIVRIRRVQCVPVFTPLNLKYDSDNLSEEAGLFPDILQEFNGWIQFKPRQWRALWVDVDIPADAPEGEYPISIMFRDTKGNLLETVHMTVDVIPAVLPKQTLIHTEWLHPDCLADYYKLEVFSEAHWACLENFIRLAVNRGVNMILTPLFTLPLDTRIGGERTTTQLIDVFVKDGQYTFGFQRFYRWIEMCRRAGVEYFEMSHLFCQWGAEFPPKIIAYVDGEETKLFGWHTPVNTSGYKEFLDAFLPALIHELYKLDIADKTYFHVSDEPALSKSETYNAARRMVEHHLKDFRVIDALSDVEIYRRGMIEHPVPDSNHVHDFIDENIKDLWVYYCCGQSVHVGNRFIAMPAYRNRILGVQLYVFGLAGFLHWGFNFYNAQYSTHPIDPYLVNDGDDSFPSGDTFIVYPGENLQPVESMRLPVLADALDDLRALQMLEKLAGRDFVLNLANSDCSEPITFSTYPRSASYLLRLRERVNEEIRRRL